MWEDRGGVPPSTVAAATWPPRGGGQRLLLDGSCVPGLCGLSLGPRRCCCCCWVVGRACALFTTCVRCPRAHWCPRPAGGTDDRGGWLCSDAAGPLPAPAPACATCQEVCAAGRSGLPPRPPALAPAESTWRRRLPTAATPWLKLPAPCCGWRGARRSVLPCAPPRPPLPPPVSGCRRLWGGLARPPCRGDGQRLWVPHKPPSSPPDNFFLSFLFSSFFLGWLFLSLSRPADGARQRTRGRGSGLVGAARRQAGVLASSPLSAARRPRGRWLPLTRQPLRPWPRASLARLVANDPRGGLWRAATAAAVCAGHRDTPYVFWGGGGEPSCRDFVGAGGWFWWPLVRDVVRARAPGRSAPWLAACVVGGCAWVAERGRAVFLTAPHRSGWNLSGLRSVCGRGGVGLCARRCRGRWLPLVQKVTSAARRAARRSRFLGGRRWFDAPPVGTS